MFSTRSADQTVETKRMNHLYAPIAFTLFPRASVCLAVLLFSESLEIQLLRKCASNARVPRPGAYISSDFPRYPDNPTSHLDNADHQPNLDDSKLDRGKCPGPVLPVREPVESAGKHTEASLLEFDLRNRFLQ